MIKTEIIAIGTELLTGHMVEEDSMILTRELAGLGCVVQWKGIVGDVQTDIEWAVHQAASRASVIVTTGGLGVAEDDVTRKAVSHVVGRRLILHEKILEQLEQRFAGGQKPARKGYARQALIPARARVLPNPIGTTHGFALHWGACHLICLPGLPREMQQVFQQAARSYLSERLKCRSVIRMPILRTAGLAESEVHERLKEFFHLPKADRGTIDIRLRTRWTGVDIDLKSIGRSEAEVAKTLKAMMEKIRERLGDAIYGGDDDTLEAVVGRLLVEGGLRLAIAESCTGGLIGHRLTNVPGSSAYLDRVEVCYSNRSKIEVLGVAAHLLQEHGAVSATVAAVMARRVRERSQTDLGLAVTGIAGPAGATPDKPVGLVFFALASQDEITTSSHRFHGGREAIKEQASQKALDLLRRHLICMRNCEESVT